MAETTESAETAETAETTENSKAKLIIIIVAILAIDIIGGMLIGTKVIIPMLYPVEEFEEVSLDMVATSDDGIKQPGIKHVLEPINLNPTNSNGEILSIEIVLEANDQLIVDEMVSRDVEIRDKLSSYLSFRTVDDLNNQANWIQYKEEMADIVNNSLSEGRISAIYVPSKIIQF